MKEDGLRLEQGAESSMRAQGIKDFTSSEQGARICNGSLVALLENQGTGSGPHMTLPLEDSYTDVINKAQRGQGLSDAAMALRTGLSQEKLALVKAGEFDEVAVAKIASGLGLASEALVRMGRCTWRPATVEVPGLAQFTTTFEDMTVNSYIVWDQATRVALAFDTGADCTPMLEYVAKHQLQLANIFLTHTHPDHIADLAKLKSETGGTVALVNSREPCTGAEPFLIEEMAGWLAEGLRVEPLSTWGHSRGGTSYLIKGLARPVVIVGDAIFASSMGGGMVSYSDALRTNRGALLTLPPETVVCPGHGPMTSIGEELENNPFFPVIKRA
jgi:hydroxyacylglutathione hydrolase